MTTRRKALKAPVTVVMFSIFNARAHARRRIRLSFIRIRRKKLVFVALRFSLDGNSRRRFSPALAADAAGINILNTSRCFTRIKTHCGFSETIRRESGLDRRFRRRFELRKIRRRNTQRRPSKTASALRHHRHADNLRQRRQNPRVLGQAFARNAIEKKSNGG